MRFKALVSCGMLLTFLSIGAPAQGRRRGGGGGSGGRGGQLSPELALPVVTFEGDLKVLEGKQFRIDQGEGQSLLFRRDKKTKYFIGPKEVKVKEFPVPGRVRVDAHQEPQGEMMAVKVVTVAPDAEPSVGLTQRPPSK